MQWSAWHRSGCFSATGCTRAQSGSPRARSKTSPHWRSISASSTWPTSPGSSPRQWASRRLATRGAAPLHAAHRGGLTDQNSAVTRASGGGTAASALSARLAGCVDLADNEPPGLANASAATAMLVATGECSFRLNRISGEPEVPPPQPPGIATRPAATVCPADTARSGAGAPRAGASSAVDPVPTAQKAGEARQAPTLATHPCQRTYSRASGSAVAVRSIPLIDPLAVTAAGLLNSLCVRTC